MTDIDEYDSNLNQELEKFEKEIVGLAKKDYN